VAVGVMVVVAEVGAQLPHVALTWALKVICRSNWALKKAGVGFLFRKHPSIVFVGCQLASVASCVNMAISHFVEFSLSRDVSEHCITRCVSS